MGDVKKVETALEQGENPMKIKKELAFEIVKELNGVEEAKKAKENFEKTVQDKEIPTDIPVHTLKTAISISDVLIDAGLASSKSEAKRLIEQGGVSFNEEKITDPDFLVTEGL